MAKKQLKLTLIKSVFGRIASHRATVRSLGLRRIRHSVVVEDNPMIRGMVNKVCYLLKIEESN